MLLRSHDNESDYPTMAKPAANNHEPQVSAASSHDAYLNLLRSTLEPPRLMTLDIADAYEFMTLPSATTRNHSFATVAADGDDTAVVATTNHGQSCKALRDHAIATILSELVDTWTSS
jgi:hypothetical protein